MLSVRGVYTGKIIKPLVSIDKKPNTPVIITFLEEDGSTQFERTREKYRRLAGKFNFGETPGEDYAEEVMPEYFSSLSKL